MTATQATLHDTSANIDSMCEWNTESARG